MTNNTSNEDRFKHILEIVLYSIIIFGPILLLLTFIFLITGTPVC